MKRTFYLLAALALLAFLAACAQTTPVPGETDLPESPPPSGPAAEITLKVMAVYDGSLLAAEAGPDAKAGALYTLPRNETFLTETGEPHTGLVIEPGAVLRVGYDGAVLESYPMQFGKIEEIRFIRQEDSLLSLYLLVVDDLYTEDPGLNGGVGTLAFDLTEATNLSEAEKSALTYIAGDKYGAGMNAMLATFEELADMGLIDREALYFETGLLFTVRVTEPGDEAFTFSASKWRSGLGAIGMDGCKASLHNGLWRYTRGVQWIS